MKKQCINCEWFQERTFSRILEEQAENAITPIPNSTVNGELEHGDAKSFSNKICLIQ